MPAMPASVPPAAPSNVRPGTVNTAVICLLAGLAVALLSFGLMLLNQDSIVAETVKSPTFAGFEPSGVGQLVQILIYVLGGVSSVYALVVAIVALFVMRRKRKARLIAEILAWLWLVAQIAFLATGGLQGSAAYYTPSTAPSAASSSC